MANFVALAATAKRLVEANGRAVDLLRDNTTPDSALKPWRGTSSAPSSGTGGLVVPSVKMAFVPAGGGGFGRLLSDAAGELRVAYDQVGLLAVDSLPTGVTTADVESCDKVRDGSEIWSIVQLGHLKPAETSLLFVLGLKR